MNKPRCADCAAFVANPSGTNGLCHFMPPHPHVVGMQQPKLAGGMPQPVTLSVFPTVGADLWCCQFLPRVTADQQRVIDKMQAAHASEPWSQAHFPVDGA